MSMTVEQLIELLKDQPQDLNVRLFCDHGQTCMKPNDIQVSYVEDDHEWKTDEIHPEDYNGVGDQVLVIAAV